MKNNVELRAVQESDLSIFFEQQLDPEATRMAAFPSRDHDAFMAHWKKILSRHTAFIRTILFQGRVAGNILCWEETGGHNVGYWLGREYWGKGVASSALSLFLEEINVRPLFAHVAKHNIASIRVLQKCGFTIVSGGTSAGVDGHDGKEIILTLGPEEQYA